MPKALPVRRWQVRQWQAPTRTGVSVIVECTIPRQNANLKLAVSINDAHERPIFTTTPLDHGVTNPTRPGSYRYRVDLPEELFMPGIYTLTISLYELRGESHSIRSAIVFPVSEVASLANLTGHVREGVLQLRCPWSREEIGEKEAGHGAATTTA